MSCKCGTLPIVTFAASLLRSLDKELTASEIKIRIAASGDLLEEDEDRADITYGVALDILLEAHRDQNRPHLEIRTRQGYLDF